VPAAIARPILRGLAGVFARRERLDPAARELVRGMAADIDPASLRTLGQVCANWPTATVPGCPVHALHGDRDWVIPMVDGPEVTVVAGGRHLLPLTHPDRVNAWLASLSLAE
jgi:pimeloyl-ACP methyl ester carboxylesterase